ncbi:MAG: transposase [Thermodesulfovibrionales bacterium]|jgi:REP element-mobilizing transposase RayT
MTYNPEIHHRRSIRLKGYDYSQAGAYFVTVCAKDHACLFGDVEQGEMILNDAGNMIKTWWLAIPGKYRHVELDECMIMPNHFHGIIKNVGADQCVCPDLCLCHDPYVPENSNETREMGEHGDNGEYTDKGEHMGSPLPRIIQWFKTMTTNAYIKKVHEKLWPPFNGKLWQRNYYEHVIRTEKEFNQIREYIVNNPIQWELDTENPQNTKGSKLKNA